MSGPKVVRIVTREEIEAMCRQHIADVEAAASELRRIARRYTHTIDAIDTDVARRLDLLREMLRSGKWTELQKQAPQIVAHLASERDRVKAEAIAAAEARNTRRRRLLRMARAI